MDKIRADFPALNQKQKIIYFDNACMTLRPKQVIDKLREYYEEYPGCAGRSHHKIAQRVTSEVDNARKLLRKSFNARKQEEIVFTKNCTEAINLVANSLKLERGDMVLSTDKEHNSNLMPWQILAKNKGILHKVVKSAEDNTFDMDAFEKMLDGNVKLVSMVHTSNLDGVTIPAKEIIKLAHKHGAKVLLDGAQSAPHKEIDLKKLDVDFFACSGHKMCGPTGIGMLYGKAEHLERLDPFIVGGETVVETTYDSYELEKPPERFEAGLQHYAGIIGFGAAVQYLDKVGKKNIEKHEVKLNKVISEGLLSDPKLSLIGPKDAVLRGGVFSFNVKGMSPHDVALSLDNSRNIMIRSGAHCVHSWFNAHKLQGSARASLYLYNTEEEAQSFVQEVKKILKYLG